MSLETATYINGLIAANPTGLDPKAQGDDHIRLVKSTILATFPNITGALSATHTQLNYVTGVTSAIQTQIDAKAPSSQPTLTGTKEVKIAMGANAIDMATGNWFTKTISGSTTLTLSNVPAAGTAISFVLDLTNGGSAVITWWANLKWEGGAAPTLTSSGRDVMQFFTHDGGTTWTGIVAARNVA